MKSRACIRHRSILTGFILLTAVHTLAAQEHTVARLWNEALLSAIRTDFARPTVHARNLFHTSVALYDAWAAYDDVSEPYLLGNTVGQFSCGFTGVSAPDDLAAARREAMSYAAYRLLSHRFANSPGAQVAQARFDSLLAALGYDASFSTTEYAAGPPAALGNYIGQCLIDFGLQDGANEAQGYASLYYEPANVAMLIDEPGNASIQNFNFWQPLTFDVFIDQSGNVTEGETPAFVSPEWGDVLPFALTDQQRTQHQRDGDTYQVYHDPGPPPYFTDTAQGGKLPDEYKWGMALVSIWSSHLDPADGVLWDISPASIGNLSVLPQSLAEYPDFYDLFNGGDASQGHRLDPFGQPYTPQLVPRGDYTRVLAEFWADGPDSETPPGHWFTILNYVNDHPLLQKRFKGQGPVLDDLEWDVKSYFILGGTMHDAAVAAWSIKGWYDYIRPVSAVRALASRGQSSSGNLPSFHPDGIPLADGFIEVVQEGDPLANGQENVGKIKLYAWRGPAFITDPETDKAGVGWILAENWWPYQRPTFVTPPFAGYVSGHSTYSRAAAEVLTLLTGDEYFPGGLGEFVAKKNEFLVFEEGPSVDITLQWATYRDASDQTSLSRIWGGIHPPADDIPGRHIGRQIGIDAFNFAAAYFPDQGPDVDFNGDGIVDFNDFFQFAERFGQPLTPDTARFDLDGDGAVDFGDLFIFAENFGTAQ